MAFFMKRKRAQFTKVFCITLLLKYNTTIQEKRQYAEVLVSSSGASFGSSLASENKTNAASLGSRLAHKSSYEYYKL